jgi:16S rRNA (uracil1498-N3)-methyltransferase
MELIIQKAVELGVYQVIPVETKRSVVKLDAKKAKNKVARWNAIAESAAKQSKRQIIPKVGDVCTFKEALAYAKGLDMAVIPYEEAKDMQYTKQVLAKVKAGMDVGIFIGPEGGFSEGEIEAATAQDVVPITLGKRILRTETAGLMILSVLMYQLECED